MSEIEGIGAAASPRAKAGSPAEPPAAGVRLNSWKEIAEYIGRDVRTAHRWETSNGLPVHRLMHDKNATVYALTSEIDEWMAKRSAGPQVSTTAEPPALPEKWQRWRLWAGAGLLAAAACAGFWFRSGKDAAPPPLQQPTPLTSDGGWEWGPQLSPDGRSVAYTEGGLNVGPRVVVQAIGGGPPLAVGGLERNTYSPVWSTDGKRLAMLRRHPDGLRRPADLVVLPALGGAERVIAPVFAPGEFHGFQPDPYVDWSPDDRFLAVCESPDHSVTQHQISIVSVATGEKWALTGGVEKIFGDYSPRFSPDGRRIAFSRVSAYGASDVYVLDLTPDLRPAGAPRRIPSDSLWNAGPTWTPDGKRLLFLSGTLRNTHLRIADADGDTAPRMLPLLDSGYGPFDLVRLGNGQLRLVYTRLHEDSDIVRIPLHAPPIRAEEATKMVDSSFLDTSPRLSPDGATFAFVSNRTGFDEIWLASVEKPQPYALTRLKGGRIGRPAWSPDGSRLAFELRTPATSGIYAIEVADGRMQQLVPAEADEGFPSFSPDGKRLYFSSKRSGAERIWSIALNGGAPAMTFNFDARAPMVLPSGAGLLYQGKDGAVFLRPLPHGEALRIFDEVYSVDHLDVTREGIFGVTRTGKDRRQALVFYSLARREVQPLFHYPSRPPWGFPFRATESTGWRR